MTEEGLSKLNNNTSHYSMRWSRLCGRSRPERQMASTAGSTMNF